MSDRFELVSPFGPKGDQPAAITKLTDAFRGEIGRAHV
jgi:excinuclease UvrABC helicase subunit UvrB